MLPLLYGPGVRVKAQSGLCLLWGQSKHFIYFVRLFLPDMMPVEEEPYHGLYNVCRNITMLPKKNSFFYNGPFAGRRILFDGPIMIVIGVYK